MNIELDIKTLRYVLYVRKSTTDESRQVRSIDDQIKDCMALANRLGLQVVTTIKEEKSAKKPHQRPLFRQMLKDLKAKKYDGILAWNPDRLARNMLEGGEIINMIDEDEIADLKFVTHYFTKDANGLMLLGMALVLSKQYSDDLSQKVNRGNRISFEEGKAWAPKHGYIVNENHQYMPDGKNFDLICEAWKMRRDGEALEKIAKYMNDSGYARVVKKSKAKIRMTADILSTQVFVNPFYYGILLPSLGRSTSPPTWSWWPWLRTTASTKPEYPRSPASAPGGGPSPRSRSKTPSADFEQKTGRRLGRRPRK